MSQMGLIWLRFRKNKLAVIGLVGIVIMILICFTSPLYISWDRVVTQDLLITNQPPSVQYPFGTDQFGRDLFARVLRGGVYSLSSGFIVMMGALVLGLIFGSIAGYFGGMVDIVIMRLMDVFMSVPNLLMAMTLIVVFGQGITSLWLALALSSFPALARTVRSAIMTTRSAEYVDAAHIYGASTTKILVKHILPNCIGPVVISATIMLGSTILGIAGMGFLGIGIASPTPEWGTILSEVKDVIRFYPYLGIIPGTAIALSVIFVNFMGDGLRDALDPRMKK
ncbi:ABC transporter permease [bacterium 1xD42-62]|uniref:ABC transporter permease n=2 Tax=Parablautia muri TaxID=2320879 RepID=A0A9X5BEZ6_9FIRM|nr:ABC transporter permease [Parablautia muri]